ncbi:hypothetical protein AWZ03_005263 [Drosophila navojoa]|uniref:Uncharacterized protein n=1 Tax=Drosophila navojoa TaxID=7232 RepID=A0A484BHS0_DRONA|nr:hypothetical protein AWZ03_005263 [Drosophila navojoa]
MAQSLISCANDLRKDPEEEPTDSKSLQKQYSGSEEFQKSPDIACQVENQLSEEPYHEVPKDAHSELSKKPYQELSPAKYRKLYSDAAARKGKKDNPVQYPKLDMEHCANDFRKDPDEGPTDSKRLQEPYSGLYQKAYTTIHQRPCSEESVESHQNYNWQLSQKLPNITCQEENQISSQSQAPKLAEEPYREMDQETSSDVTVKLSDEQYQQSFHNLYPKLSEEPYHEVSENAYSKLSKEPYQQLSPARCRKLYPEKLSHGAAPNEDNPKVCKEKYVNPCADQHEKSYQELSGKSNLEMYQQFSEADCPGQSPKLCMEEYRNPYPHQHQNPYQEFSDESTADGYPIVYQDISEGSYQQVYQEQHLLYNEELTSELPSTQSLESLARQKYPQLAEQPYHQMPELSHQSFSRLQGSNHLKNYSISIYQETKMTQVIIDSPSNKFPPARKSAGMGCSRANTTPKKTVSTNQMARRKAKPTPCAKCNTSAQTCERNDNCCRSPANAQFYRAPTDVRFRDSSPNDHRSRPSQGPRSIPRNETNWEAYDVEPNQGQYTAKTPNSSDTAGRPNTVRMCCEARNTAPPQRYDKPKRVSPPPKPFCKPCSSPKPNGNRNQAAPKNLYEPKKPPPVTPKRTRCDKACVTDPPPRQRDRADYSGYSNSYGAAPSKGPHHNYHEASHGNLQLCPHCETLFEPRSNSHESDYKSYDLVSCPSRNDSKMEPKESSDYTEYVIKNRNTMVTPTSDIVCMNPSCSKPKGKKPNINYVYGYRPCEAPQRPETEFSMNDSKVDYMELQSGSGRFLKNPLTVSRCSCNVQKRFIPEPRRKCAEPYSPPYPQCEYKGGRVQETNDRRDRSPGIPPLNNNAGCANFVPVKYFQENSRTPTRNHRFSSGLAPRSSSTTQRSRSQPPSSSSARIMPESSLHLTKRRFKLPSRRLSDCGHQSIFSLKSSRIPIAKPCTLPVSSKALRLSACLCHKCKQRCRGGKLTANTHSLHSTRTTKVARSRPATQAASSRSNQASSSKPKRTQSTTAKREKVSIQTQTASHPKHLRSSRPRDQSAPAKPRPDLPARYQLPAQNQNNSKSTARAATTRTTSASGRERTERAPKRQQQQQIRVAEKPQEQKGGTMEPKQERALEIGAAEQPKYWQDRELRVVQYPMESQSKKSSKQTPRPLPVPDDPVQVVPQFHMQSHGGAGCMGTNLHHFYRASFLSIRPTLPSENTQAATRQRHTLLHVAESILRPDLMQSAQTRCSSFVVPNKWQSFPNINGFVGATGIVQLESMNGSRTSSKSGGWLRSWRKLLPNWLSHSKIKTTSA